MKAIEWISSEAKKIRKKYPKKEWKDCIKQASAIYKSKHKGKVSGTKKPTKKSLHKDTKSHNVNIRVVSGIPKSKVAKKSVKEVLKKSGYRMPHGYTMVKGKVRTIGSMPSYKDSDMAREIELYADNDNVLYFQKRRPILINLGKKFQKGTYDVNKAAKLWRYYIDAALQKYNKEFGSRGDKWYELMSTSDRNLLSMQYAINSKEEFELGNFTN